MSNDPIFWIDRILPRARSRRVLDLGCGVGRHARLLAQRGCDVVAIDASEAVLEEARAIPPGDTLPGEPAPGNVEFLLGDMGAVEGMVRGHFGAALCLGNTLSCLLSPESLSRMLIGLKRRLLPGSPFLFQVLNYDRLLTGGHRALPVEFVETPDGERVVVRLIQREDGIVLHTTATLRHQPTQSPMVEVVATRATQLRGWRRAELEIMLDVARFSPREVFGDMRGAAYDPDESLELVMIVD